MKFQENVFFITTTEETNIYPILEQASDCQMTTFSNNIVKWDCEIFETIPTQIHEHDNLATFKTGSIEYNEIEKENDNEATKQIYTLTLEYILTLLQLAFLL